MGEKEVSDGKPQGIPVARDELSLPMSMPVLQGRCSSSFGHLGDRMPINPQMTSKFFGFGV